MNLKGDRDTREREREWSYNDKTTRISKEFGSNYGNRRYNKDYE